MELKKTPKANLENKRPSWLLVGYVIVLACMFVAFEWTHDVKIDTSGGIIENIFEQGLEIPITEQPELVAPPPPAAPAIADILTIVDDETNVDETPIISSEDTGDPIEIKPIAITTEEEAPVEDEIFEIVEETPEFINGGLTGLMQYLSKNLRYPAMAQEANVQGRVTVQFVVNKDGSIVDVTILRGVDPALDKEAVRVISAMPKWKPGKQRGKPVRCKYTVPVTFKLQ